MPTMIKTATPLLALTLALAAGSATPAIACPPPPAPDVVDVAQEDARPVVEVVFVLDTTGSMAGLIEGAKQTIWSIATEIARAEPTPTVRMGLVAYRDRSDDYVVRSYELTEDLDAMYTSLMTFAAGGGGDTPESVNEALNRAVTGFEWSDDPDALKLVYLVGDAPPHMDYQDDVPYMDSCTLALERGLIINTIQCGSITDTEPVWREIARRAEGGFIRVEQSGGAVVIETPFDAELASLGADLGATSVGYGDASEILAQARKREAAESLDEKTAAAPAADRAMYNASAAGARNAFGRQDLVADIASGTIELEAIPEEQLPEPMQAMTADERRAYVEGLAAQRAQVQAKIAELSSKRTAYQRERMSDRDADGFDRQIVGTLRDQARAKGLELPEPEADTAPDTETSTDTDA
ncbi:MAG: hypothetical protein DHS20C14_17920 [Phycisphaeraceae bacterium]|nr:MAG: hypothetical protein DHS20C14_17920 [Phycisphaeraceae bacterium]